MTKSLDIKFEGQDSYSIYQSSVYGCECLQKCRVTAFIWAFQVDQVSIISGLLTTHQDPNLLGLAFVISKMFSAPLNLRYRAVIVAPPNASAFSIFAPRSF